MSLSDYDLKKVLILLVFLSLMILALSYAMSFLSAYTTTFFKQPVTEKTISGIRYAPDENSSKILVSDDGNNELNLGNTAEKNRSLLTVRTASQQEKFVCTSREGKTSLYEAGPGKTFIIANAVYAVSKKKKENPSGVLPGFAKTLPTELPLGGNKEEDTFTVETSSLNFKLETVNGAYGVTVYPACPDMFPLQALVKYEKPVSGNVVFKVPQKPVRPTITYDDFEGINHLTWTLKESP